MRQEITLEKGNYHEVGAEETREEGTDNSAPFNADGCDGLEGLPQGFLLYPEGLFVLDNEGQQVLLGSWLRVNAIFKDAGDGSWGKVIELRDPDGEMQVLTVLDSEIIGKWSMVYAKLAGLGFRPAVTRGNEAHLKALLTSWRPRMRNTRVNRIGVHHLHRPVFVLGNGRVVGSKDVVAGGHAVSSLATELHARGTLEEWREGIGRLCSGNPLLILAVSMGFFGPVLGLIDPDMAGGFHLGGQSSSGKTSIAEVLVSVWGTPKLKRTWNSTANGLEAVAGSLSGTVLVLDEMGEATAKVVGAAIYMLANGTGRGRMASDATLRASETWSLPFLSTGELNVSRKLAEAGIEVMAGQSVRLIEVVAEGRTYGAFDCLHGSASGAAFADLLKARSSQIYGSAGDAFVEKLFEEVEAGIERIHELATDFLAQWRPSFSGEPDGQVLRVLKRFAHIAAAGELATQFGITGWPQGAAFEALGMAFGEWLDRRDDGADAAAGMHLDTVRKWVADHWLQIEDLMASGPATDAAPGWRDAGWVYLSSVTWVAIHGDTGVLGAARALDVAGVLRRGEGRNITSKAPRAVPGRLRVYKLKLAAIRPVDRCESADASSSDNLAA